MTRDLSENYVYNFMIQIVGDPFNGFTYEPSFNSESLQQHRIAMMQEDYF